MIIVCLGPTFIYLPAALLDVPHQASLVMEGYMPGLWTIAWYPGVVALAVAVRCLYVFIRDDGRRLVSSGWLRLWLVWGVLTVASGPHGTFVLGGNISAFGWLTWVVLPFACIFWLIVRSRDYVLDVSRR